MRPSFFSSAIALSTALRSIAGPLRDRAGVERLARLRHDLEHLVRICTHAVPPVVPVPAAGRLQLLLAPHHPVLDRVDEGFPAGLDDVLAHADAAPGVVAVAGVEQHPRDGAGALVLVEDAHLVVHELDVAQMRVLLRDGLAQRRVEGVDRAVALGGADDALAADVDLDGRLHVGLAALALLDDHAEALEGEQRLVRRQLVAQQQVERGVGRLVVVAAVLALLEPLEHDGDALVVALELQADVAGAAQHRALARELRDEDALLAAHDGGVDVLEGLRRLLHGGHVQPALVGEGRLAHVGLVRADGGVADVGHEVRRLVQARELLVADHRPTHLELERRDDADQVGVAAALAVAVHGALHLQGAGVDGDEAVGHGAVAVVVHVHADRDAAGPP